MFYELITPLSIFHVIFFNIAIKVIYLTTYF